MSSVKNAATRCQHALRCPYPVAVKRGENPASRMSKEVVSPQLINKGIGQRPVRTTLCDVRHVTTRLRHIGGMWHCFKIDRPGRAVRKGCCAWKNRHQTNAEQRAQGSQNSPLRPKRKHHAFCRKKRSHRTPYRNGNGNKKAPHDARPFLIVLVSSCALQTDVISDCNHICKQLGGIIDWAGLIHKV